MAEMIPATPQANTNEPQGIPQESPAVNTGSPMQESAGAEEAQESPAAESQEDQSNASDLSQLDPQKRKKIEGYITVLMNELHGKETRDDVIEILKSSKDPYITIPQAALAVNDAAANKIAKSGGRIDLNTQFVASQYLVSDLMEIGNSFGIFKTDQKDYPELLQDSLQMYIERGLKNGSIDPIELQVTAEKFMSKNQKIGGHYFAQQAGLPYAPQATQIMQQVEQKTTRDVRGQVASEQAKAAKAQNDQQVRQALVNQQMQGGA